MSRAGRMAILVGVLTSFTACGAMMWFENDAVVWLHVVLLAAAFSILSGPDPRPLRRAGRALLIGLATLVMLVLIALGVGWIADRTQFFSDGGPAAVVLVIGAYIGLPAAFLGAVVGGLVPPTMWLAAKLRTRQPA
jgi:hypothetical protein